MVEIWKPKVTLSFKTNKKPLFLNVCIFWLPLHSCCWFFIRKQGHHERKQMMKPENSETRSPPLPFALGICWTDSHAWVRGNRYVNVWKSSRNLCTLLFFLILMLIPPPLPSIIPSSLPSLCNPSSPSPHRATISSLLRPSFSFPHLPHSATHSCSAWMIVCQVHTQLNSSC